ncbi:hypothetical protein [Rhizobacter sp. LjRoot28]|uniref:hypothetical protein n=1 Tax=Rhizobacter sp. LjRoot28 TaxID=3342309 RepID=UPI003ECFEAAA
MRFLIRIALYWCVAAIPVLSLAQSPVEYCEPYNNVVQLTLDPDKPFLQYALSVTNQGAKREVQIVADELRITRAMLGSLIKFAAAFDPSITSFRLDARRISFVESLAFRDARITFVSEEIDIASTAVLSLLPSAVSRINLSANTLRLNRDGIRHFDVRFRGQDDDLSDVPRILEVAASSIMVDDTKLSAIEATDFLSQRFTLAPLYDFRPKIGVLTNAEGRAAWEAETKQAEWPSYSIAVWRASMTVAPFDRCLHQFIRTNLDKYKPLLENVVAARQSFEMNAMLAAMDRGTDLQGNGAAWLTNRPLSQLVKDIAEYETKGPGVSAMDFYIDVLERAAKDTPPDPSAVQNAIAEQESKVQGISLEYQSVSQRLGEQSVRLRSTLTYLDVLNAEYQAREQRLKQYAEDLKQGAQDRAQIISALSTAASIAATAYTGNPATGAAVGGVITAVGGHVSGQSAWTSLSNGYKFYTAVQGPLKSMSGAINELKNSRDTYEQFIESFKLTNITIKEYIDVPVVDPKPGQPTTKRLTRDEALKDLDGKTKSLYASLTDAYGVYEKFVPPPSDVPIAIEEDESLKALAESIATNLEAVKETTKQVEALTRSADEKQLELTGVAEKLVTLRTMSIADEQKRRELVRVAFDGMRDELARFTSRADLIRRASIVEYRAPVPINVDHLQRAFLMQELDSSFDPTQALDSGRVLEQYVKLLRERREYAILLAGRIRRAAQQQFEEFVESRGRTPLVNLATEQYSSSIFDSPERQEFMRMVNATLREQYHARGDSARLALLYRRRLEIPFSIKRKIDARFPARLLKVGILEADSRSRFADTDLILTIDVERVGNLRQSADIAAPEKDPPPMSSALIQVARRPSALAVCERPVASTSCFAVDLRPKTTPPENYFVPYEFTIGQVRRGVSFVPTPQQSYWYLDKGDSAPNQGRSMMVTYPPAEARMYLRMRLNVQSPQHWWNSPPELRRLVIGTEVFQ